MLAYNSFYKNIDSIALAAAPSLAQLQPVDWDHLISPYEINLARPVLQAASDAIRALYALSRRTSYQNALSPSEYLSGGLKDDSVLMAYDFHTTTDGRAFLIEINTNASGFLVSNLISSAVRQENAVNNERILRLKSSFEREIAAGGRTPKIPRIAITDEDPEHQKMFREFLMYRDLFQLWGWQAEIVDSSRFAHDPGTNVLRAIDNNEVIDAVYNRTTDFYFHDPKHTPLKDAVLKNATVITPQPKEYLLLADKQRLIDFSRDGWLEKAGATAKEAQAIRNVLIPTFEASHFGDAESLWSQRKTLFFKPKNSFGGKSVYRGESVSRKVFERILSDDLLVQEFVPAQRMPGDSDLMRDWKFDVRFYVYRDEIQHVAARSYQGQVTNFSSPYGGFTPINFI